MKKLIIGMFSFISMIVLAVNHVHNIEIRKSDSYIRDRVVLLKGNNHMCTGFEVKAPSGKIYTMTAAHCKVLIENAHIEAENEQGKTKKLEFIAIDIQHDLMILSAFDDKSLNVANKIDKYEHIHTIAHGRGYPAYRDDGQYIGDMFVDMVTPIYSDEDLLECVAPSTVIMTMDGFLCMLNMNTMKTTLHAVPESSGGPALNSDGEVIGVVSSGDSQFTNLAKIQDIQAFLKNR